MEPGRTTQDDYLKFKGMNDTLEQDFVGKVVKHLKSLGAPRVTRLNAGYAKRGPRWIKLAPAGWPDVVGFWIDGTFMGWECKREVGDARDSSEQSGFIKDLTGHGGIGGRVRSIEEVDAILRTHAQAGTGSPAPTPTPLPEPRPEPVFRPQGSRRRQPGLD